MFISGWMEGGHLAVAACVAASAAKFEEGSLYFFGFRLCLFVALLLNILQIFFFLMLCSVARSPICVRVCAYGSKCTI